MLDLQFCNHLKDGGSRQPRRPWWIIHGEKYRRQQKFPTVPKELFHKLTDTSKRMNGENLRARTGTKPGGVEQFICAVD
jgi:hypothetical protein